MAGGDPQSTEESHPTSNNLPFDSSRDDFTSPASPPYSNLPPNYQSRTQIHNPHESSDDHSNGSSSNTSSLDKGKGSVRGTGNNHLNYPPNSAEASPSQPPIALTQGYGGNGGINHPASNPNGGQGPRIAVTDPLADMRARNLSKPEGLGLNSDWPSTNNGRGNRNMMIDTSSTLNYLKNHEKNGSGGNTVDEKLSHPMVPTEDDFAKTRPGLKRRDSDASSDGDAQFDDFDWSDDDDVEEAARFEEAKAKEMRMGRLSVWKILRFLSVTFLGNLIVSCALIVPVIVIQFVYRPRTNDNTPPAEASHRDYVADNIQAWFIWAAFNLHVEWWLHILVELVPRAVLGVISLAWGRPSQRVKSGAEFFDAIKNYIKLILYAALSWGSWAIIFNSIYGLYTRSDPQTSRAAYLYRIYQVIEFLFFFILTISAEKMLIKTIAMSFHASAYADRINEVTRNLKVFDRLKDYRPKSLNTHSFGGLGALGARSFGFSSAVRSGRTTPTMDRLNDYAGDDEGTGSGGKSTPRQTSNPKDSTSKKHSKKRPDPSHSYPPSATITPADPQGAGAAVPRTPGSSSLAGKVGSKLSRNASRAKTSASQASKIARVAMNDPFGLLQREDLGVSTDINSPSAAKRLAKQIFLSFRGHHKRTYLIPSDFDAAYPTVSEAKAAFSVFDRDGNGDISMTEIKNTVLSTYKERRFLSRSMQDVNHAVGQLDFIFLCLAMIIVLFEAFAIFNIDIDKTLTTFYSLAIAFAFIFKESAQNVFDSIIFLFVTHPFDTGDRIQLDDAIMVVKKMSLLSSEFTMADQTDMYVSNALLSSMMIINIRRSGYQWECATVQVAFDTPLEKLDAVEADMIHWLSTEPERHFEPSTAIVPQTINYMRYIECTIGMTHRANWQDWGARFYRKNAFFAALTYYMKKHGINYIGSNQPIVYWKDDADAPPYDDAMEEEGPVLDDFNIDEDNPPLSAIAPSGHGKPRFRSFMNFTPPADELDNLDNGLKKRKARRKAMANQGGDG